ncbi:hypothetical protein [Clostridium sp.]|uniref:hypothetical protein n=1 Tax=Clostridium sp. TaxID=1506 RepID=UPI002FC7C595
MKEKDFIKEILSSKSVSKEDVRKRVINTISAEEREAKFFIKNKLIVTIASVSLVMIISFGAYGKVNADEYDKAQSYLSDIGIETSNLSKTESIKVYKDMESANFKYDTTKVVLMAKANELGIENVPQNAKEIYQSIVDYYGVINTGKVTSSEVKSITPGITYKEIIQLLGPTKDIGSGLHVLQYVVDDNKLLYINFADENDICEKSGDDFLKNLIPVDNKGDSSTTFNCTLIQRSENSLLVSCPTYTAFDTANVTVTEKTIIVFENGEKATLNDVKSDFIITFNGTVAESYPVQITATKIVIK